MSLQSLNKSLESKYNLDSNDEQINEEISLEENATDTVKGIFNQLRANRANQKANKLYKNNNYIAAKAQRDKAAELKRQSAYNFNNSNKDLLNKASNQIEAEDAYNRAANNSDSEYSEYTQKFDQTLQKVFADCDTKKDLDSAYQVYLQELSDSASNKLSQEDPLYLTLKKNYKNRLKAINKASQPDNKAGKETDKNIETTPKVDKSKQIADPDLDDYTGVLINVLNQAINDKDISCNETSYKKLIASFRTEVLALLQGKRLS